MEGKNETVWQFRSHKFHHFQWQKGKQGNYEYSKCWKVDIFNADIWNTTLLRYFKYKIIKKSTPSPLRRYVLCNFPLGWPLHSHNYLPLMNVLQRWMTDDFFLYFLSYNLTSNPDKSVLVLLIKGQFKWIPCPFMYLSLMNEEEIRDIGFVKSDSVCHVYYILVVMNHKSKQIILQ